ncbi:MAG: DUF2721 domain-containing protein [Longimicrobiales bacterium]
MQISDIEANPFAILSFIIAPAILTNASSVLAMSTSNRLARAVDRARELTKQLEEYVETGSAVTDRRLRELAASETRALMLIRALDVDRLFGRRSSPRTWRASRCPDWRRARPSSGRRSLPCPLPVSWNGGGAGRVWP